MTAPNKCLAIVIALIEILCEDFVYFVWFVLFVFLGVYYVYLGPDLWLILSNTNNICYFSFHIL